MFPKPFRRRPRRLLRRLCETPSLPPFVPVAPNLSGDGVVEPLLFTFWGTAGAPGFLPAPHAGQGRTFTTLQQRAF